MQAYEQHLKNEAATLAVGRRLAQATFSSTTEPTKAPASGIGTATCGAVIHLHGDLGAGKTTLTRGILRGYGYLGAVKSPTYTLVEPYEFEHCSIYHFDLYRLADPGEVEYLGTEEYFSPRNLCIVEWAERGGGAIPAHDLGLRLEVEGNGRLLIGEVGSGKGEEIAKRLWSKGRFL